MARTLTLIVIGFCALLGGCILSPRQPDGPPEGDSGNWEPPITTNDVLQNLRWALLDENSNNYRECFTEDYEFHVDPQDSLDAGQEGEALYANWTREDEEHSASRMFADAARMTASFTTIIQPDETQSETYRQEDYTLIISWASGAHVNEEITYRGRATIWMKKNEAGRWAIFRWVDRRLTQDYETWGALRGEYRF